MATEAETARRDERVRVRAYMIWEAEGRPDGRHLEHGTKPNARLPPNYPPKGISAARAKDRNPPSSGAPRRKVSTGHGRHGGDPLTYR